MRHGFSRWFLLFLLCVLIMYANLIPCVVCKDVFLRVPRMGVVHDAQTQVLFDEQTVVHTLADEFTEVFQLDHAVEDCHLQFLLL